MSAKHLTLGSQQPPKDPNKLRLYSMEYCPYAQRVRLVLLFKSVPHDIVNLNLIDKPEWYFNIHPEGKVPALDIGDKVLVESLDICEYLEEKYPTPALYPADPGQKAKDKELVGKISDLLGVFIRCLFVPTEQKSASEWAAEFAPVLQVFEDALATRNTDFFGGAGPGMVDLMLWPWAERSGTVAIALGEKLPFEGRFELFRAWKKRMMAVEVVGKTYHGPEKFWKIAQFKLRKLPPDYDNV